MTAKRDPFAPSEPHYHTDDSECLMAVDKVHRWLGDPYAEDAEWIPVGDGWFLCTADRQIPTVPAYWVHRHADRYVSHPPIRGYD